LYGSFGMKLCTPWKRERERELSRLLVWMHVTTDGR
jgi:hypothetical protein